MQRPPQTGAENPCKALHDGLGVKKVWKRVWGGSRDGEGPRVGVKVCTTTPSPNIVICGAGIG